jgi:ADP-ribosylglycohydrolase
MAKRGIHEQYGGFGTTTANAITRFLETGEGYCGSSSPSSAGNGSIMRLCLVPLFYAMDSEQAIEKSALSSKSTHAAEECLDACRLMAAYILAGLHGWPKEQMLDPMSFEEWFKGHKLTPRIAEILEGSYKRKEPPDSKRSHSARSVVSRNCLVIIWTMREQLLKLSIPSTRMQR